jgi:hypothetical protein
LINDALAHATPECWLVWRFVFKTMPNGRVDVVPDTPRMALDGEAAFLFGSFRLLPSQHLLLENDRPVQLGSRAFEILDRRRKKNALACGETNT